MAKRLQSMDVTIRGVTRSYEFDPAEPVDSDDEGEASLQLLGEAETTEVQLTSGITNATVAVSFTVTIEGTVNVDLSDLEEVDDEDDIINAVEGGDFDDVSDAISQYVERNFDASDAAIDNVDVEGMFVDDGNLVD